MKHGLSPTTRLNDWRRRGMYIHISVPLAYEAEVWEDDPDDPTQELFKGYAHYSIFKPLPLTCGPVRLVRAPVKAISYRRTEPKATRPGRTRRTWLAQERAA